MSESYKNPAGVDSYLHFLHSQDGQFQQEVLCRFFLDRIARSGFSEEARILDAGCSTGWLTARLHNQFPHTIGCDSSSGLIGYGHITYPHLALDVHDLNDLSAYQNASFDVVVLSMVLLDVENLSQALSEVSRIAKPEGTILVTIPNPYYAWPVGMWKRGLGKLLFQKPKLLLNSYVSWLQKNTQHSWRSNISSHFRSLPEYLNAFTYAGFGLIHFEDLVSKTDSSVFSLEYQLHRFPLILGMELKKKNGV